MASSIGGSIIWLLDVDKARFDSKLTAASSQAKSLSSAFDNFNSGLQSAANTGAQAVNRWSKRLALAGVAATAFAVKSAADFEQSRIAFETMLGSADGARLMLKNLSDFARKTPFTLPEVVTGAKQLLAYGISAERILPDLKSLGDIAAGVGRDKLPQLILAFGQVATKGHLAGQEIRQFTEAGVPLVEQLAKTLGKTKEEIVKMSEAGEIGFEDVRTALGGMTGEGGRFFNLMDKQSRSFSGVVSNLQDNIGRLARRVVGINEEGDIRKNSIFAKLVDAATILLTWLDKNADTITRKLQELADKAIKSGTSFIKGFVENVKKDGVASAVSDAIIAMLSKIDWAAFTVKAILLLAIVIPQIIAGFAEGMFRAATEHPLDFLKLFLLLGFLPGPILLALTTVLSGIPIIGPIFAWIIKAMGSVATMLLSPVKALFLTMGNAALAALDPVIASAGAKLNAFRALVASPAVMGGIVVVAALASLALVLKAVQTVRQAIADVNNAAAAQDIAGNAQQQAINTILAQKKAGKISAATAAKLLQQVGGRASGGPVLGGTPYIVGERGPELFVPSMSGRIVPNDQLNTSGSSQNIQITLNMSGVMTRSRGDLREISKDMISAVNESLRARGVPEIGGGAI